MKYHLLFVCLLSLSGSTFACNGYQLRLDSVENCGELDQVILIDENSTISLTPDCILLSTMCVYATEFSTAKMKYNITKNGLPFLSGKRDVCKDVAKLNEMTKKLLQLFQFPENCPVETMDTCTFETKEIDMKRYSSVVGYMRGMIEMQVDIEHDTGSSCVRFNFEVHRK